MKNRLIMILSVGIIVLGACIFAFPFVWKRSMKVQNYNIMEELETINASTIEENLERPAEFDFQVVEDISAVDVYKSENQFNPDYAIGLITIDSIGLNLPVMKGISNSNLNVGAATMKDGQKMGEGNYALAGHYNSNPDILFGGIMNIKVDDIIVLSDKVNIYEYRVYETKVVDETDINMIWDEKSTEKGKPVVTLMTCYYSSKTGKRYFVLGELVNKYLLNDTILPK